MTEGSTIGSTINTIVQGIPAKPVGRFDMFVALRKMEKGLRFKFPNQKLPDEIAVKEWERFYKKRDKDMYDSKM